MTEDDNVAVEPDVGSKDSSLKPKEKKDKYRYFTKIVCRRLPPTMTAESFLEQVSPIPDHDYFYFTKADPSLTPDLFSKAYINFVNVEDIFIFRDKFDDYIFLDEKGNEYPAIVEYAPFQRIPKKRRKKDPKSGSLESDPTYLEFLESLKETDSDCREPKMEYSFQLTEEKKETTTPLLEFLATRRREEKRRKEERQRRRIRHRNIKEEDILDEDIKKIKPRDVEKSKENVKYGIKKKDEESTFVRSEQGDSKEKISSKNFKSLRDSKKFSEEPRKKGDFEKKEFKNKVGDNGELKLNRKERRERQREALKIEKGKEVKVPEENKKEKADPKTSLSSFRQIDDAEQDRILSLTIEGKKGQKAGDIPSTSENETSKSKTLISSNIKPFTELPQYKMEDLSKVVEKLDKQTTKKDSDQTVTGEGNNSTDTDVPLPVSEDNTSELKKSSLMQQRSNSLESSDSKKSPDDSPLRRNKSLDDKSQDDSSGKEGGDKEKGYDSKKERRLRNKDRPSIVIYQPGMGKFSKQRIDRKKDSPTSGTFKPLDPATQQ